MYNSEFLPGGASKASKGKGGKGAAAAKLSESKPYRPAFVWAQCTAWFKQTVYDPTASLSAERRGMLSLPDVETAYSGVSHQSEYPLSFGYVFRLGL